MAIDPPSPQNFLDWAKDFDQIALDLGSDGVLRPQASRLRTYAQGARNYATLGQLTVGAVAPTQPGGQRFKDIWGAYTIDGAFVGGNRVTDNLLAFEAQYGRVNTVVTMTDIIAANTDSSMWGQFGVSQADNYHRWTPALRAGRNFVITWLSSFGGNKSGIPDQNLLQALADPYHDALIDSVCRKYLVPIFGDGTGLVIRMPHEWEPNFYPWGIGRDPANTPELLIRQQKRQVDRWRRWFPKVKIEICCAAGFGTMALRQAAYPGDDYCDVYGCDIYDVKNPPWADARAIFEFAKSHGKQIAVTETGPWENGDDPDFYTTLWDLMRQYDVHHLAHFEAAVQGVDHRLSTHPKMAQRIRELMASG